MRSPKFDALLSRYYTIIIFLIPALTIFTLFVVLPIGEAAYYSFFRWNGYGAPEKFVGFKNYEFLFKNRVFILSLKNNFYIIAISLFVQLPFALLIALMISDKLRGAAFFRTVFLDGMAMVHLKNLLDLKIMNFYLKIECLFYHSKIIFI